MEISNSKLNEEIKKRKKAEHEVEKLKAQLEFAKKNKFGDKRQKVKRDDDGKPSDENPDHTNEQDNFDGTDATLDTKSVSAPSDGSEPKKLSNRPDTYNAMGVQGASVEHPSDDTKVPGRILERKMVKVFHFETRLVEEHFEMIHYVEKGSKPKWGYFPKSGHRETVTFSSMRMVPAVVMCW